MHNTCHRYTLHLMSYTLHYGTRHDSISKIIATGKHSDLLGYIHATGSNM